MVAQHGISSNGACLTYADRMLSLCWPYADPVDARSVPSDIFLYIACAPYKTNGAYCITLCACKRYAGLLERWSGRPQPLLQSQPTSHLAHDPEAWPAVYYMPSSQCPVPVSCQATTYHDDPREQYAELPLRQLRRPLRPLKSIGADMDGRVWQSGGAATATTLVALAALTSELVAKVKLCGQ